MKLIISSTITTSTQARKSVKCRRKLLFSEGMYGPVPEEWGKGTAGDLSDPWLSVFDNPAMADDVNCCYEISKLRTTLQLMLHMWVFNSMEGIIHTDTQRTNVVCQNGLNVDFVCYLALEACRCAYSDRHISIVGERWSSGHEMDDGSDGFWRFEQDVSVSSA